MRKVKVITRGVKNYQKTRIQTAELEPRNQKTRDPILVPVWKIQNLTFWYPVFIGLPETKVPILFNNIYRENLESRQSAKHYFYSTQYQTDT
jgi:hypothetical protein